MDSKIVSEGTPEPDDLRWYLLQNKIHEARIREAFQLFRTNGIEPILIKGWAIARLYPESHLRTYTDIDLGVSSANIDRARILLEDDAAKKLNIDLHNEFRHLDNVEWSSLLQDSELVPIDGVDIRILSPEDHLRVLCVHWLTDSGSDRERLWDIYYAVQNRPQSFDWEKCLGKVSETRRKWIVFTIGLTSKYLGLNLDGLPFADEAEDIPGWLPQSVEREWRLGVPLRGLYDSLHDWRLFVKQVRKRLPPNPLYATIECEGEFDDRSRVPYQLRSLLRRVIPGARKIAITLRAKSRKNGE